MERADNPYKDLTSHQRNTEFRRLFEQMPSWPDYDITRFDGLELAEILKKLKEELPEPIKNWKEKLKAILELAPITSYLRNFILLDSDGMRDIKGRPKQSGGMRGDILLSPSLLDRWLQDMGQSDNGGIFDNEQARPLEARAYHHRLAILGMQPGGESEYLLKSAGLGISCPTDEGTIIRQVEMNLLVSGVQTMLKWKREYIERFGEQPYVHF